MHDQVKFSHWSETSKQGYFLARTISFDDIIVSKEGRGLEWNDVTIVPGGAIMHSRGLTIYNSPKICSPFMLCSLNFDYILYLYIYLWSPSKSDTGHDVTVQYVDQSFYWVGSAAACFEEKETKMQGYHKKYFST